MLELPDEAAPIRHFYAVGHDDRNRAEWAAVDQALTLGAVATSPVGGVEPVEAFARLSARTIKRRACATAPSARWARCGRGAGSGDAPFSFAGREDPPFFGERPLSCVRERRGYFASAMPFITPITRVNRVVRPAMSLALSAPAGRAPAS